MWFLYEEYRKSCEINIRKIQTNNMKQYYVYATASGILKLSDQWVAGHVLKIQAKTEAAAKRALTNHKKLLKQDGE